MSNVPILELRRFTVQLATDGSFAECDGIEYDGKLWLVPEWDEFIDDGMERPARMIRFDHVQHEHGLWGHEYLVNRALPPGVLRGIVRDPGYEILVGDEIPFVLQLASKRFH